MVLASLTMTTEVEEKSKNAILAQESFQQKFILLQNSVITS